MLKSVGKSVGNNRMRSKTYWNCKTFVSIIKFIEERKGHNSQDVARIYDNNYFYDQ